ncbi:MAG: ATP-binding protein, partial [Usitatibacter sp.]
VHQSADGAGRRIIGATISIDDYKRAEEALRESDRRKDEFLAMLAHELRNPLAPISTAAEILRLDTSNAERVGKASEVIGRQVAHITKLVDDLLDVSRVTRGLIELDRGVVDLSVVIQDAVEQALPLIEAQRHVLTRTIEAPHARVRGDRARLVQVIANLLNNAARYTLKGGRIDLSLRSDGDSAVLRVADNGQGIDAALMPHVFDLFTQGARTPDRSLGGLGIGLALVKRLVELHGGAVRAESAGPGQGSAFTVALPLVLAARAESLPRDAAGAGRARRIMVVDDNRDAAESLATLLEATGHSVEEAYDAEEALASPAVPSVDFFILDIGLPGMDGFSLARRLRERNANAEFVALTGYGQAVDAAQSRSAGFDHHFVKPVDLPTLQRVLLGNPAA